MLKNLNVHGGFTPATLAPPSSDNPQEGNNSTITLRSGGQGGQALSPPSKHVSFLFCTMIKGILMSRFLTGIIRLLLNLHAACTVGCGMTAHAGSFFMVHRQKRVMRVAHPLLNTTGAFFIEEVHIRP